MPRTARRTGKQKASKTLAAGPLPPPAPPPPPPPPVTTVIITIPAGAHPMVPSNFTAQGTVSPANFSVVGWVLHPSSPNPVAATGTTAPPPGPGAWRVVVANAPVGNNRTLRVDPVETPLGRAEKPIDIIGGMMVAPSGEIRDGIQLTHPRHGADLSAGFIARGTVADAAQRV